MPSRLPGLLAATGLALTVLAVSACSQQPARDRSAAAPAAVPGSTAKFGDGPAPAATVTPVATATAKKPAAPLADGRWPGFITKVGDDTVAMDLVEFLTGDAAAEAWQRKHPESEQDSPDNDYFIVNDNGKLRELPLSPDIQVQVVGAAGPGTEETIAVSAVTGHFGNLLKGTLFWFTVKQGEVTRLEQQFLP